MDITKFLSKLTSGQTFVILLVAVLLPAFTSFTVNYKSNQINKDILYTINSLRDNNINHLDYRGALFVITKTTNYTKNAILRDAMMIISQNNIDSEIRQEYIRNFLRDKVNNLWESDRNRLKMFSYSGLKLDACLVDVKPESISDAISLMIKMQHNNKKELRNDLINYLDNTFDQVIRDSDIVLLNVNVSSK